MKLILKSLIKFFLQGLVILGPIAVTAYCIYFVFYNIDTLIPGLSKISPGIGFITIIACITFLGFIGERFFLTRWILSGFDALLEKIPGIKFIYSSTKDIISSFVGDKKKFNNPVWVKTQSNPEIWRIGFLTQKEINIKGMEKKISVYLPHSYAISGWVIITEIDNIKPVTEMTPAQAMKFAVSGGVTGLNEEENIK